MLHKHSILCTFFLSTLLCFSFLYKKKKAVHTLTLFSYGLTKYLRQWNLWMHRKKKKIFKNREIAFVFPNVHTWKRFWFLLFFSIFLQLHTFQRVWENSFLAHTKQVCNANRKKYFMKFPKFNSFNAKFKIKFILIFQSFFSISLALALALKYPWKKKNN